MPTFRFRLAKVLDWYQEQSRIESERLRISIERVAQARVEIERHGKEVLARQMELIASPAPQVHELAALEPFRRKAKQHELQLRRKLQKDEQEVERQRGVYQAAERRLRLIEKLRERRLSEHEYQESKELEELASEAYLARFARDLNSSPAT
jgi:flagellar export protein FliJ